MRLRPCTSKSCHDHVAYLRRVSALKIVSCFISVDIPKPCASAWHSHNMTDEEETPAEKPGRRNRFKSALSRTKTKLRKKDNDDRADDEVEDFLAAGRNSTSTGRPSLSDSFTFGDSTPHQSDALNFADSSPSYSDRPPTSDSSTNVRSTQIPHPDSFVPPPQQSPRRVVVPRIDVSSSQRYPSAQPVQNEPGRNEFLKPQYQGRSQSVSSLSKGRGRARGLSVSFTETPPIVIGEGGDEAQAPTIEVSKAKRRARSVSPTPTPRTTIPLGRLWSRSPINRKPVPQKVVSPVKEEADFFSPGIERVQTGMASPAIESKQAMDKEFEMSLGLSSASTTSPGSMRSPQEPILHAPKPVRPPVPIPSVGNIPALHNLKSTHGTKNLRSKYERDQSGPQDPFADPSDSGPNRRFYAHQQQQLPMRHPPEHRGRTEPDHQRMDGESSQNDAEENWL